MAESDPPTREALPFVAYVELAAFTNRLGRIAPEHLSAAGARNFKLVPSRLCLLQLGSF